jgi:hypothetical protein
MISKTNLFLRAIYIHGKRYLGGLGVFSKDDLWLSTFWRFSGFLAVVRLLINGPGGKHETAVTG